MTSYDKSRDETYRLRLVRGGEPVHNRPYVSAEVPAGSSQIVEQSIVNEWPNSRYDVSYDVHGDGTVTDKVTTLIWKQCPEGLSGSKCDAGTTDTLTWEEALERANTVNDGDGFAGSTDWRLPNRNELLSLSALDRYDPAINITVFPGTPSAGFWSTSPSAYDRDYAWGVDFHYGNDYGNRRYGSVRLRLVRGGQ